MTRHITALVTSVGSDPAVAVIQGLKRAQSPEFRVIGTDMDQTAVGFGLSDRAVLVPAADAPGFMEIVEAVVKTESVDVVLPVIEEELPIFARAADRLRSAGLGVVVNEEELLDICLDKQTFFEVARRHHLPVPETFPEEELSFPGLPFPLVLKRRRGRRTRPPTVAAGPEDVERALLESRFDLVGQRRVAGCEYTVELIVTPHGELLASIPRQRLATKGGICTKGRLVQHSAIDALARQVTAALRITGPANLQCIEEPDGRLHLIEINPKFPGGGGLTIAAGINPPELLARLHLGLPVGEERLRFTTGRVFASYRQALDPG